MHYLYSSFEFNKLTRDDQLKHLTRVKFEIDKTYCVKTKLVDNYRNSGLNEWQYLAEMMRLLINYVEDKGILPIHYIAFLKTEDETIIHRIYLKKNSVRVNLAVIQKRFKYD